MSCASIITKQVPGYYKKKKRIILIHEISITLRMVKLIHCSVNSVFILKPVELELFSMEAMTAVVDC